MAGYEAKTDMWVRDMLKEAGIKLEYQGVEYNAEVKEALRTASKSGTGYRGTPEFVGVVKDYLIVIECKKSTQYHKAIDEEKGILLTDTTSIKDYAVNGVLHYARHIVDKTTHKKVFAIAVSGNEKSHIITPYFVDEGPLPKELKDLDTLISFSEQNIDLYYHTEVLEEDTQEEKTTATILKHAEELHDMLWKGGLTNEQKPLVVSGLLLALNEENFGGFSVGSLTGDQYTTDGQKIYNAIEANLRRSNVTPQTKLGKVLAQFAVIRDTARINQKDNHTGKTPLRIYTEYLKSSIKDSIMFTQSAQDHLGLFYGEFMSYTGRDGQDLGIVLTPKHITTLFCDLAELTPDSRVLDPCCGTGGFLIAAMHTMLKQAKDDQQIRHIKQHQLMGIELQTYMFTIATTNMILRGDGKSNLYPYDFLVQNPNQLQSDFHCNVGMMNPPYSQGSKNDPDKYEICFTEHLLDSLVEGGRAIVIVPQSTMTGKTKVEKDIKRNILKHHTLEGVITLNKDTFYGVGTNPCIAVFTAHQPHHKDKLVKFINFEDDGFEVSKHIGLVDNGTAKDRRAHLLNVWQGKTKNYESKFCVETTVEASDEWLHSFYYFNDEIPTEEEFRNTMADYLTFEFNMITHGRGYLFTEYLEQKGQDNE